MPLAPQDVIEQLRAVYGAGSDEDLSQRTGLNIRLITRWKAAGRGKMPKVDGIIDVLSLAGLLRDPGDEDALRAHRDARIREVSERLVDGVADLRRVLEDGDEPAARGGGLVR